MEERMKECMKRCIDLPLGRYISQEDNRIKIINQANQTNQTTK